METNFNFNSQICTSRSQSERLMALGLKKETADMMWDAITIIKGKPVQDVHWSLRPYYYPKKSSILYDNEEQVFIPAWSLHRLIEMMPEEIEFPISGMPKDFHFEIHRGLVRYYNGYVCCVMEGGGYYKGIIDCIEWLIKEGYFNEEYLV